MSVSSACLVLSGRGLCDELITRPEESYRLCVCVCVCVVCVVCVCVCGVCVCVCVCDLDTSNRGGLSLILAAALREEKNKIGDC